MAEPPAVGEVHAGHGAPPRYWHWCRSCGATELDARLIEVAYPGVARVKEDVVVIVTRETVCEDCLAHHDALIDFAQMNPEEVPS